MIKLYLLSLRASYSSGVIPILLSFGIMVVHFVIDSLFSKSILIQIHVYRHGITKWESGTKAILKSYSGLSTNSGGIPEGSDRPNCG